MDALIIALRSLWLAAAAHLWQTTVVLALLYALGRILRGARAGVLYLLWSLAFAKLFLPMPVLGGWIQAFLLLVRPGLASFQVSAGTLTVLSHIVDPIGHLGGDTQIARSLAPFLLVLMTLLWLSGATWGVLRLVREHRRTGHVHPAGPADLTAQGRAKLQKALAAVSIPEDRVVLTSDQRAPCVAGLGRPRILLPAVLVERLPGDELTAVLLHEETHRRRHEPLRTAVIAFGSSLYFFYPLLGSLRRRLAQSAELICDEKVVGGGIQPEVYTRALARTVRLGLAPAAAPHSAAAESGSFLLVRLRRIRAWRARPLLPQHVMALILAFLLVVAGSLLPLHFLTGCARDTGITPRAAQPASTQETPANAAAAPGGSGTASGPQGAELQDYDEAPVLISLPAPVYPDAARKMEIEGVVQVRALIGEDGLVQQTLLAVSVDPHLDEAATKAMLRAKFKPAQLHGRPVAVWVQIPMRFTLH